MSKKTNVNESDFDWTNDIPDNPVSWVEPKITLSNVEKDEGGWPIHEGDGDGEIWIDFERFSNDEKIEIIRGIESYLGVQLQIQQGGVRDDRGVRMMECTSNMMKGLLLHCGHEDNHFFATENHVCCMDQNYNEFMEYERNQRPNEGVPERPVVDGGLFLEKGVEYPVDGKNNLTEGFYYKGVNPTVDLIVIRGDEVLLIQRDDDAEAEPGKWALPGGFHDTNAKEGEEWKEDKESSLDAAKREVKEETGLDVDSIKGLNFVMVGVYEGGGRDPRDKEDAWTRSTVYMVHIPEDEGEDVKGMDDVQRAEWVPIDKVLQHKLAFDHHKIIEKALTMNESDAFNDLGLLTESNDFEWADIEPTRSDRMNFNKSRFKSHVEYGNDVNLGDRFLATGSPNIWEITMKLPSRHSGESFHIVTKNEAGKLKHFYWKPTKNPNQVKGSFPHTFRPWKKIVGTIDESNDFKWIEDVPDTTLGELFDNGELSVGDRVHVMGSTKQAEREKSVISINAVFTIDYVGNEFKGITVLTDDDTKRVLDVEDGDDHSDNFSLIDMDRNLMVVKHEKSIGESKEDGFIKPILKENLDWIKDIEFEVTDDYIKSLMSNCKDIQITNYNLNNKSPYLRRGKMNVFYYSMCPYWWELLKDIPNDEDGRGKGEWFKDDDNGKRKVAVIMPDRNGVSINNLRDMDIDDFSAITYDLKGISRYFNGKRYPQNIGELWILLDDNGDIRYDLIPEHLVDEVRKGFEGVERLTTLEESFDWTEDIPEELDQKLYELIANVIDDEVSQGPYYDQYIQSDSFRKLDTILSKYNIDTGDMSGFFTFGKPTDKNGEYITNYQLYDLKQDLVDAQFMLSDNDAREMLGESDLEWVAETKKYPYVGMKFRYEGKGILYTVTEVTDTLVTIKWIKPKYGGVEQRTTDLSQVEGLIRDKTWVPVINESNDFEWTEASPDLESHRFFDINVCYSSFYDEDTGEDECREGGSYHLKIPREVVPEIWDYEAEDDYVAGPGDEGYDVIQWCLKNGLMDGENYDDVQYVTELTKSEYCRFWGDWQEEDKGLCRGHHLVGESEFDWAIDDIPPFYTLEWKEHPLAIVGREVWGNLIQQGLTPPENSKFHNLKQARKEYPNGKWISVVSGPNWIPAAFDEDGLLDDDTLGDKFEVFSSNMDDPEIMTIDGINSYMKLLELES